MDGLGQSVGVEDKCVARRQVKMGGNELRLGDEADGVTADAVDVGNAPIGQQLQRRQMASAGELDIKSVVTLRQISIDHGAESVGLCIKLLSEHGMQIVQHLYRIVV